MHKQLADGGLRAIDVIGDGNCYFRALSFCLFGHEQGHMMLRKTIVDQLFRAGNMLGGVAITCEELQKDDVRKQVAKLKEDGSWVGEDMILASAAHLQREIHVYVAMDGKTAAQNSPRIYSAPPSTAPVGSLPLLLAYYEPGHYRAVVKRYDQQYNNSVNSIPPAKQKST